MLKLNRLILLISLAIIGVWGYGFFISLSDDQAYGKYSLDYLFLTPDDLTSLSQLCESTATFTYSSTDGPKPAITSLNCKLNKVAVLTYLKDNNFNIVDSLHKKENIEIDMIEEERGQVDKVTLLEYL